MFPYAGSSTALHLIPQLYSTGEEGRENEWLTHRNCQSADGDLYRAESDEHVLYAVRFGKPIEALEGKPEGEEVLEDEEAGEAFHGHVA
jgi:antirestriction protein ArdC